MARIFEVLQKWGGPDTPVRPDRSVRSTESFAFASAETVPVAEAGEEIPFVEVGGPKLEFSSAAATKSDAATGDRVTGDGRRVTHDGSRLPSPVARHPSPDTRRVADSQLVAVTFQPLPLPCAAWLAEKGSFAAELIAFHQPEHPVSRQYRAVWENMQKQEPEGVAPRVLLLSGAVAKAGTSAVLLNLAVILVQNSKQRVVVVDANSAHPTLAEKLGLPGAPGLQEVLTGAVPLPHALRQTALPGFQALVAGDTVGDAGGRPGPAVKSLSAILRHLRKRFDRVLVDLPAWHGGAEMLALSSTCDSVYLVLPHDQTQSGQIKDLIQAMLHKGVRLRGCIQTQR